MIEFIERDAKEVFEEEFLNFAGYNLQRRALPDARDGLKWGARKLLHSQMLGKLTHDKPFKKAIKSVSQAMGFSYTHGNASAYGTYIRMAKPFAYRIPLQEANGNYGTLINPDDHSADRYVELRGSEIASILLKDLEKDTVTEWEDTYDMEGKFPRVLPAKGFWNGVNGCISIGSGMSSSLPPLNLKETNEAMIKLLWDRDTSFEDICCFPDFPTGATVLNRQEVFESLRDGKGSACKIRASIEFDSGERCFIVKELPYSVYTNTICKELAKIMDEDENCGIKDFCDYTKQKPDLRIYLAKRANPDKILKRLYKETSLQNYFSINMTVLDKGIMPVVMGQKELFLAHLDHEIEVYTRGFQYDLRKINARLHIIEGLLKAISMIDEVVRTIKQSKDTREANANLRSLLSIDETQAKAILDIKLARLAHLEVNKLEKEKGELEIEKARIEAILNDENLLKKEVEKGLREVASKFGDARRTKILNISSEDSDEPTETRQLVLNFTNQGSIFIDETSTLYAQRKGGVGAKFKLDKGEYVVSSKVGDNTDTVLFFSEKGDFYSTKMSELPVGEKVYVSTLIKVSEHDKICNATVLSKNHQEKYIIFFTKNGMVKKSLLDNYNIKRKGGIKALELFKDDKIVSVIFTNDEPCGILSATGNLLLTQTKDIRAIGRTAKGVKGIKLDNGDSVVSARAVPKTTKQIVSITKNGISKRTDFDEFAFTSRDTKGRKVQKILEKDFMVDFMPIESEQMILIVSSKAQLKCAVKEITPLSRGAQGNKTIKLKDKEQVVGLAKI